MDKSALIFLTHVDHSSVKAHYSRLKRETAGLMDTFMARHCPDGAKRRPRMRGSGVATDVIIVTERDQEETFPLRFRYMKHENRELGVNGYLDTVFFAAARHLSDYAHIYLMEYDVDYAGHWATLFSGLSQIEADFVAAYFTPRHAFPEWVHWADVKTNIPESEQLYANIVFSRFSKAMRDMYVQAIASGKHEGNAEALWPSLANRNGLSMIDIRDRCGNHFGWRPVQGHKYFHEDPNAPAFEERDRLVHPIKP